MEWRGSRSKNTVFQTVIETQNPVKDRGQLVEKVRFLFCASCDSTHKIEFAQQIHKNRGRGPDHPLLPLCGNSPCVPRFLYKGRKNVSGGRGFSSAFDRKRGFDREAARKTIVFRQPLPPVKDGVLLYLNRKKKEWKALHSPLSNFHSKLAALQQTGRLGRIDQIGHAAQADAQRRQVVHHRRCCGS